MKREKVVVIEDEANILEVIAYNLKRENYQVLVCQDGEEGLSLVRREAPDLVLLDLMLPGLDGIEVCRRLKADPLTSDIPIVMVTAKGEESDIVLGLGIGADDYIPKPFSPRELVARVRAVLRRGPLRRELDTTQRVVCDGVALDPARHEVLVDAEQVEFTATEFRLLHVLLSSPAIVFTREQLINRVIGDGALVDDRNIDVHIRALRKKLGSQRDILETVRGVGYRCVSRTGNQ
ncbi:response regulator [bacterium]|nr:response regulator [bacterium]